VFFSMSLATIGLGYDRVVLLPFLLKTAHRMIKIAYFQ
jgi:hypothetical protein